MDAEEMILTYQESSRFKSESFHVIKKIVTTIKKLHIMKGFKHVQLTCLKTPEVFNQPYIVISCLVVDTPICRNSELRKGIPKLGSHTNWSTKISSTPSSSYEMENKWWESASNLYINMFSVSQGSKVSGKTGHWNKVLTRFWKRPLIAQKSHLKYRIFKRHAHNFRGHRISPRCCWKSRWSEYDLAIRFSQKFLPKKNKHPKTAGGLGRTIMLHIWISCWNYRIFIQHTICFKHTRNGNSRNEIWKESGNIFWEVSRDYI